MTSYTVRKIDRFLRFDTSQDDITVTLLPFAQTPNAPFELQRVTTGDGHKVIIRVDPSTTDFLLPDGTKSIMLNDATFWTLIKIPQNGESPALCQSGGAVGGNVPPGTPGQVPIYSDDGSTLIGSVIYQGPNGNVGVGAGYSSDNPPVNQLDVGFTTGTQPDGSDNQGGIHVAPGVPGNVIDAIYNDNGVLTWNGKPVGGMAGTPGYIPFFTDTTVLGDSTIFQDSNGNVGIGTAVPKVALQVGSVMGLFDPGNEGFPTVANNLYYDPAASQYHYIENGYASAINQDTSGRINFYTAAQGAADAVAALSLRLEVNNDGGLIINPGVPATTVNALYSDGTNLLWNGQIVSGGVVSGSENYVAKFNTPDGKSIGDSAIFEVGGQASIGTTQGLGILTVAQTSASGPALVLENTSSGSTVYLDLYNAGTFTGSISSDHFNTLALASGNAIDFTAQTHRFWLGNLTSQSPMVATIDGTGLTVDRAANAYGIRINDSAASTAGTGYGYATSVRVSGNMLQFTQDTSDFHGNCLVLAMQNGSGTFDGNYATFLNSGSQKFSIDFEGNTFVAGQLSLSINNPPFDKFSNTNQNIEDQGGTGTTGFTGITWSAASTGYMMGLENSNADLAKSNGLLVRIANQDVSSRVLTLNVAGIDVVYARGDGSFSAQSYYVGDTLIINNGGSWVGDITMGNVSLSTTAPIESHHITAQSDGAMNDQDNLSPAVFLLGPEATSMRVVENHVYPYPTTGVVSREAALMAGTIVPANTTNWETDGIVSTIVNKSQKASVAGSFFAVSATDGGYAWAQNWYVTDYDNFDPSQNYRSTVIGCEIDMKLNNTGSDCSGINLGVYMPSAVDKPSRDLFTIPVDAIRIQLTGGPDAYASSHNWFSRGIYFADGSCDIGIQIGRCPSAIGVNSQFIDFRSGTSAQYLCKLYSASDGTFIIFPNTGNADVMSNPIAFFPDGNVGANVYAASTGFQIGTHGGTLRTVIDSAANVFCHSVTIGTSTSGTLVINNSSQANFAALTVGSGGATFFGAASFNGPGFSVAANYVNANGYYSNGIQVIDINQNLTNIGNLGCGSITVNAGNITITSASPSGRFVCRSIPGMNASMAVTTPSGTQTVTITGGIITGWA
jgi:hypothetical protein